MTTDDGNEHDAARSPGPEPGPDSGRRPADHHGGDQYHPLREFARQLDDAIESDGEGVRLVGPTGEAIEVPAAALRALKLVAEGMSAGLALSLIPYGKELTTQEAADLLHVSRPHLVKLLEEGRIRHHRVGTHRRVRLEDVLAFAAERTERRREELRELTRLSQEAEGGYV